MTAWIFNAYHLKGVKDTREDKTNIAIVLVLISNL